LIYWTGKQADPNGWIYKTAADIEEETGLSYYEQQTARKQLLKLKFIEEQYKRLDHQMVFRVMANEVNQQWGMRKDLVPEPDNTSLGNEEIPHSLNESETTSEITTEITYGEKTFANKKSSVKADVKADLLPSTEGGKLIMLKLTQEQNAKGRGACKYFESLAQKQTLEAAEARLGNAEFEKALQKALETGITQRSRIVNYIVKWNPNRTWTQPTLDNGQPGIIRARD
jgi:hypothetical protein